MRPYLRTTAIALVLVLAAIVAQPALAHRPYFEEEDIGPEEPWLVDDPSISTAVYATLESAGDVDYFALDGQAGQVVLLALTIPQIEGQEEFAPTMALLGPGLEPVELPERVVVPEGTGALEIPPPSGPAPTFFEPFTRTSYWDRQEEHVDLPAAGRYVVAVWHPEGQVGRYVFVVGEKEQFGGDPAFLFKMRSYWTPVGSPATRQAPGAATVVVWTLLGFLLGAMPFSVWLGRLFLRSDVRNHGNGNPGAANAWRAGGWRVGVPAGLLDYAKGLVPVGIAHFWVGVSGWQLVPVSLAPVLGHAFSPFLRFRGGKAVAATFGVWTGLTLGEAPTLLGLFVASFTAVQAVDAWTLILGMLCLLAHLLLRGAPPVTLAIWAGNTIILAWKQRRDLRQSPRLRPWTLDLVRRGRSRGESG